jgi:hypothetical protein
MKLQLLLLFWIVTTPWSTSVAQSQINFTKIDQHAKKAPQEVEQDLKLLADYLAEKAENDLEKVRSTYVWITHHIQYDNQAYQNGNKRINRNNQDVLNRKKAVCFGYSTLLKALCEQMGVEAELISGYSWNTLTSTGHSDAPDHAWNAVKIDTSWYLLDATWGSSVLDQKSTFLKSQSQDYFLVDPRTFILSHLPQDPMWQLLDCPIDLNTFFNERFKIGDFLGSEEACFDFRDSIANFKSMSMAGQKIKTAENAVRFNPSQSMKDELASTYIDQAGILSNQVENMDPKTEAAEVKKLQEQMIAWFRKAAPITELYDWQRELYINTLINQAVVSYNSRTAENQKERLKYSIGLLQEAQDLLVHSNNIFFKNQVEQQCTTYLEVLQAELRRLKN